MKKLFWMMAGVVLVSLSFSVTACGNRQAAKEAAEMAAYRRADSLAALAQMARADSIAAADSIAQANGTAAGSAKKK
jgi:uncharacterized lipoprotein YehR (DUF1307 family)